MSKKNKIIKQVITTIRYSGESICVSFDDITRIDACRIGAELINQRICNSFGVEWCGQTELWLDNVDSAALNGFEVEYFILEVIKEIAAEMNKEIVFVGSMQK